MLPIRFLHRTAPQQVGAVSIRNGERVAAHGSLSKKPAFEVRAPNLIRCLGVLQRLGIRWRPFPLPAWMGQAFPSQQVPDAAGGGPDNRRSIAMQISA